MFRTKTQQAFTCAPDDSSLKITCISLTKFTAPPLASVGHAGWLAILCATPKSVALYRKAVREDDYKMLNVRKPCGSSGPGELLNIPWTFLYLPVTLASLSQDLEESRVAPGVERANVLLNQLYY